MEQQTRKIGFFSALFGLLSICAAALGIFLALNNRDAAPSLVVQPEAAQLQVQNMLDALVAGDYETVSSCLHGQPRLGIDRAAEGEVGLLFWEALASSFRWEQNSDFYATDSGVALDVTITALDLSAVTANLRQRTQALLELRVAQATDTSEIYDENNEFRESVVMDVLYQASLEALDQDTRDISWEITLNLIYENGQWWILPEQPLLTALSGGTLN